MNVLLIYFNEILFLKILNFFDETKALVSEVFEEMKKSKGIKKQNARLSK